MLYTYYAALPVDVRDRPIHAGDSVHVRNDDASVKVKGGIVDSIVLHKDGCYSIDVTLSDGSTVTYDTEYDIITKYNTCYDITIVHSGDTLDTLFQECVEKLSYVDSDTAAKFQSRYEKVSQYR